MIKKYTSWFKTASVLQILTGCIHSLSFINEPQPANETEKQLIDLMSTYKMDLGNGFTPTMENIMTSFSITFVLLLLFAGIVNLYILKKGNEQIHKGMLLINVIIFGTCFFTMFFLTFLPPIVCIGLIWVCLIISWLLVGTKKSEQ